jgi:PPM family protein phosphatase
MGIQLIAYGQTDQGKVRSGNEDFHIVEPQLGLYIVCDGMGGHASGEVASQLAATCARDFIKDRPERLEELRNTQGDPRDGMQELIREAMQYACAKVFIEGKKQQAKRGMGTTMDCVLQIGNRIVLGHVGDSRVYLRRQKNVYQLTEDHTMIAFHLRSGLMTRAEAAKSAMAGVLTRCIGSQRSVQVDTLVVDLLPGDRLLMCSDGLHNYLAEGQQLAEHVTEGTAQELAEALVRYANHRGGEDNITALVIDCKAVASIDSETTQARISAVQNMPIFRHLTYKEQVAVLSIARAHSVEEGKVIVREGEKGDELYIMVQGRVQIEKGGLKITELRGGGHFGEMSIVDYAPRSATVKALEPTELLGITQYDMGTLMRKDPVLGVKILWSLSQGLSIRLRASNDELHDFRLATPDTERRPFVRMEDLPMSELPPPPPSWKVYSEQEPSEE